MSVNPYLKKKKHGSYWDHTDSQSTSMTWCSCGLQILTAILITLLRSSNSLLWSCSWGLHAPLLTRCYYPNPACKVYKLLLPSHACPWGVQAHAAAPNVFKSQKFSFCFWVLQASSLDRSCTFYHFTPAPKVYKLLTTNHTLLLRYTSPWSSPHTEA